MFDVTIRTMLQQLSESPPPNVSEWYGPWYSILFGLFPASEGYIVVPKRPNFMLEVSNLITPEPFQLRTILIVKFKNSQHWDAGIPSLEGQINRVADAAFSGSAISMVYWIAVIGPHWRYGAKDDGQALRPLIDWHDTTDDQASYDDLQYLTALIADTVY
jgi:hypothetical protein